MKLKGNALLGQSGGPTAVINASLAGIIEGAEKFDGIDRVLGMRFGIEGFMSDEVVDLSAESPETISGLKNTPSSALGSCRHKLSDEDFPRILEMFRRYYVRYLFLIGGNDTMDTIHRIGAYAAGQDYELCGIGVPKTVDNDLFGTDHTPGYGSAARYVALSVMQAGLLARDMQRVDQFVIFQAVGRDAGWLAAASALASQCVAGAPHLIYVPERPFEMEQFLADVEQVQKREGWVSIVVGEGIAYADGTPVSASQTADKFRNIEFGAMGGTSAAMMLHKVLSEKFGWRGEFQVTESLQMCASDRTSETDVDEAYLAGRAAVDVAAAGASGLMVTLQRENGAAYRCITATAHLSEVAVKSRPMPDEFINAEGNGVTGAFLDYLRPLVGELPTCTSPALEHA